MYPLIQISLAKALYDKRERDVVSCQKMEEGTDADGGNDFSNRKVRTNPC